MSVKIISNRSKIEKATEESVLKALEMCGLTAEGYAKDRLTDTYAVDTGNLRNSVTHKVDPQERKVYVGTNVHYGPYIEYGTGIYTAGGRRTSWTYKDGKGNWHRTNGMKARPFIKPSVADHQAQYQKIIKATLKGV